MLTKDIHITRIAICLYFLILFMSSYTAQLKASQVFKSLEFQNLIETYKIKNTTELLQNSNSARKSTNRKDYLVIKELTPSTKANITNDLASSINQSDSLFREFSNITISEYPLDKFNATYLSESIEAIFELLKQANTKAKIAALIKDKFLDGLKDLEALYISLKQEFKSEAKRREERVDSISILLIEKLIVSTQSTLLDLEGEIQENRRGKARIAAEIQKSKADFFSICGSLVDCKDCTSNPTCGWCFSSNSCIASDSASKCEVFRPDSCMRQDSRCGDYANCNVFIYEIGLYWESRLFVVQ